MTFVLGQRSLDRLKGVHPDLVRVVQHAIAHSDLDFCVLEGLRTPERQAQLVAAGASQTHKSRHLTGHAVDLGAMLDGEVRWDWPLYSRIAQTVKNSSSVLNVPIEWGGDWKTLRDGPHFQLPWDEYPA